MGMEVEAEGLLGVWPSLEYIRMPGGGNDGGRGRKPGRKAGAMNAEDIVRIAREAWLNDSGADSFIKMAQIAFEAGSAAEREACCDLLEGLHLGASHDHYYLAAQSLRQLRAGK